MGSPRRQRLSGGRPDLLIRSRTAVLAAECAPDIRHVGMRLQPLTGDDLRPSGTFRAIEAKRHIVSAQVGDSRDVDGFLREYRREDRGLPLDDKKPGVLF